MYSSTGPFLQVLPPVYRFSVEPSSNVIGEAQILFSFHHETRVPERVSDGTNTWNCSVAHWPEFQHHFPCDLVPQCREGQDEAECPYAGPECNDGYLHVNGSCYQVVQSLCSVCPLPTLWASLSGTFVQTLPDLVTPLKRHSLSPRSCPPTRSAPSERFGY